MKLRTVRIENFRGISLAEIDFADFTTLVGPNNIGKSTILSALNMVLDNRKPKIEDWPGQAQSNEVMTITCTLEELEPWEKAKPAISKLLHDDTLQIRMIAKWPLNSDTPSCKYYVRHSLVETPFEGKGINDAKKDPLLKQILVDMGIAKADDYKKASDDIKEYMLEKHPEMTNVVVDWHEKSFANSLQQAVPHVMYVPASFKIEDELKTSGNSPFAYLFTNKLFPKVEGDNSYIEYINKAQDLQKKLKGKADDGQEIEGLSDVLGSVSSTLNDILDFDSKVKLAVGELDIKTLFTKAATFLIDDELETSLQYQGSGVQRALAFAMLESNAEIEAQVDGAQRTTIVLYEEPELYIHPHLMRRLRSTLQKRSGEPLWQVICSTHSPFLIDLANKPESIKLIKRADGNRRVVSQLPTEIFEQSEDYDEKVMLRAVLDFHPTVCESLFAKRVVVVEGDTEVAVFSMIEELVEKLNIGNSKHKDTTVVSAGGKWTIPAIVKVLKGLGIEYKVVHDTDKKGKTAEELEKVGNLHPYRANAKISAIAGDDHVFRVDDTFEHVLWGKDKKYKSSSKPYHSWRCVRGFLDGKEEITEENQATLKEIIEFAFCD
ncbi:ATP-dependent endonuclease [Vibrio vulnificus]|uniref:ATP-dependent nuclease n=1 Tax=Vibrio vulnificus TaxID=672 RepID=UPI0009B5F49B|nr:AAA family ATPase [Vibrio vulnificus]EGQ7696513.1 AAA family ATPase [Vibrio vulnificus]EHK9002322.1 ATP-dependent endonuclease [Vibrio vulnificus]EIE1285939.1 ATP-dependent endonuclease [Vibrio vulnificus]EIF8194381.1 ATP-dependent endonuclease [Vibrio vulnificus]ELE7271743.1 ATP-dependent endonuclease [Vibrio vulnificus]